MADNLFTQKVVCQGGLITNASDLDLSDNQPGAAVKLVNFEPSLFGGYRKLDGYQPWSATYPEVDPDNAEGPILGVAHLGSELLVARKQQSGATYKWYHLISTGWEAYDTSSLTLVSTGVTRIRYDVFNFLTSTEGTGQDAIIMVDGVNNATMFDGTNWTQIKSTNTGADFANAGSAQALDAPAYVKVFNNTIFLSGDSDYPTVVAYSAPSKEYDWTSASGAGQIISSFAVNGLWPFRDSLYVFGLERIKKITLNSSLTFVIQDVTTRLGCIAPDSIGEIGGDLIFLSQDGFRPVSGTDKIGDVQLETISKQIQRLVKDLSLTTPLGGITNVLVRSKSQIRFFFSQSSLAAIDTPGIIGGLRNNQGNITYEWGELKGIRANCCTSYYSGKTEYIIHGDYDGKVYRQEQGNDFNGEVITSIYRTPYLDLGDTGKRKTFRKVRLFLRPEGDSTISTNVTYDWDDINKLDPDAYSGSVQSSGSTYGTAIYGTSVYGGKSSPFVSMNIEGSAFSAQFTFTDSSGGASYSIQAFIFDFSTDGRK